VPAAAVAPDTGQGQQPPSTPAEKPKPVTSTSTNATADGNKVEPGSPGGLGSGQVDKSTTSGDGLAAVVKSVTDRISSAIPKADDGNTTKAGSEESESKKSDTDGASK
jgi:hypothetical protein